MTNRRVGSAAASRRRVLIAGTGLHPFGRFPQTTVDDLGASAATEALQDGGVKYSDVDAGYYCHVLYQGASPGERVLGNLGLTGIPIINVENACSSGTTGLWQAYWAIALGQFDSALVVGTEQVPSGPVQAGPASELDPGALLGRDNAAARYALKAREYMESSGAPIEALAEVVVKARENAYVNPKATVRKLLSRDDVLGASLISDPLTKYHYCPNAEGASACLLVAADAPVAQEMRRKEPRVELRSITLNSDVHSQRNGRSGVERAAAEAYAMAGVTPSDVDVVQVHDAASSGELVVLEDLGLFGPGTAWKATLDGVTRRDGSLPVNTDGGMLGLGHPFGATGLRMTHELANQIRGEAGERQVDKASVGVFECAGANGVTTVGIVSAGA